MSTKTLDSHIAITPGTAGGRPRIAGRRIKVQDIVIWHEWQGLSPDEIAADYDLSLADIYAALAYYHDHREQINADIKDDDAFVAELKKQATSTLHRFDE